ncbi:MAG: inositol monophosphatase family protein [Solirubrobacteraceae bacterium]
MPSDPARRRHDGNTDMLLGAERAVDLGARLLRQGRRHLGALIPKGDRDYATDVDLRIEEAMRAALDGVLPGVSFLGEEEGGDGGSGTKWVLDPIDGTINFIKGSPLCSISLALLRDGQPVFGIVDLPLLGERYVARSGVGAFLNGDRIAVSEVPDLRDAMVALTDFAVGDSAKPENELHLRLLARLQQGSLRVRVHGSEALDLAWLAAGRLNASVMLSNIPWDVSAGVLLVREAGGAVLDYDGSAHGLDSRFTIAATPSLVEPLRLLVNACL